MRWYVVEVKMPSGLIVYHRVQIDESSLGEVPWFQFEELATALGGELISKNAEEATYARY